MATQATRSRRTQAERSAETRKALIEATISLLCRLGYSGTTTTLVAEEAGVSRGAYQHQFNNRTELIIAVVQTVYDQEVHEYFKAFEKHKKITLADFPEVIWSIVSRPSGMAVFEILNGMRSDPELAERLLPIQMEIERNSVEYLVRAIARRDDDAFEVDREKARDVVRLMVWAARGLAVMQGMETPAKELRRSMMALSHMFRSLGSDREMLM